MLNLDHLPHAPFSETLNLGVLLARPCARFIRLWRGSLNNFSAILMKTEDLDVVFLYLSKKFEWDNLRKTLENWIEDDKRAAVIGDTNMDYMGNHHKFIRYNYNYCSYNHDNYYTHAFSPLGIWKRKTLFNL